MSRTCDLTGTGPQTGHLVSHSNRKTKTRFMPNLQVVSLLSDALGQAIRLRVTAATLRSVEHNGGLNAFLVNETANKLTPKARALRSKIKKKLAA